MKLEQLKSPVRTKLLSLSTPATQADMVERRLQGLMDLGLTEAAVAGMLSRMPTLLGYQSKQLQAMREYLGGLAGLSRADVASLLQKEPRILSYSVAGVLGDLIYALLCMCPRKKCRQRPAQPNPEGHLQLCRDKFSELSSFACYRSVVMCPAYAFTQGPSLMLLTS